MKHVLFVDDEPNVLSGLQRMLRTLRTEWTMGFVSGGAEALEYMAKHAQERAVDVVVTDMRMPGMSGAELLKQVVVQYPGVVRIALSGHSDHEMLLKVAGLAHQYLSKPCDTEALKATVRHALNLRDHLGDDTLKGLVSKMSSIPSVPANYQEVLQELKSPEPSLRAIGDLISRDVAMTAKVLQLVNSAFFGLPRRVTNPQQAVALLGLPTVSGLVLSVGVFTQFDKHQLEALSIDDLMAHCLDVASLAKRIAVRHSKDETLHNDAFVAGMLHDVGKLVLAVNFPEQYNQAVLDAEGGKSSLCAAEREMFGADHASVGGYILGLWGLPTALIEAITFHHHPSDSPARGFHPLTAVHVANAISKPGLRTCPSELGTAIDEAYLQAIGMREHLDSWLALAGAGEPVGAA
jgi:HD-like signal output (HDOD) protein/CheY-like chemotaxis protein